jgi:hypothetical protein
MPVQKHMAGSFFAIVYHLGYTLFYAGFFFRRTSHHPFLLGYSTGQWLLFFLLLLPYKLPAAFRAWRAALGARRAALALTTISVLMIGAYSLASLVYYNNQTRLFDPFTQVSSAPLPEALRGVPVAAEIRILVLGGSTSMDYPRVLLPMLQKARPDIDFKLVNEAMGFYTVKHSLVNFTTYYDDFHPDIALCLHGINDLTRSFNPPDYAASPYDERWTHFYGPAIHAAAPPSLERLASRSVAWVWARDLRVHEVDMVLERYGSLGPYLRHTERLLDTLKAHGVLPVVLTQPTMWREDPMTPDERPKLCFQEQMCIDYRDYFHQEFPTTASLTRAMAVFNGETVERAKRSGAICIDAAQAIPRDVEHFIDDCHFTPKGLELLAQTIAGALIEQRVCDRVLAARR